MDTTQERSSEEPWPPESWPAELLPEMLRGGEDLVAVGGDLAPQRLVAAYSNGIFPWYEDGSPILWWCPEPRAVLEFGDLHVTRRLARKIRAGQFRTTLDAAFPGVISRCGDGRPEGTWITSDMVSAYTQLHREGYAHSVECWRDDRLVGGIYGIAIGGLFAGESMFYREPDASKIALARLVEHISQRGYTLFDVQILNEHTESLGATAISRREYLERLRKAVALPVTFGDTVQ